MKVFKDYATYYNAFYKDKNYSEEAKKIDFLLKKSTNNEIQRIINFGCGTGKHDFEMGKLGYQCFGIDLSPMMVKLAKKSVENTKNNVSFEVADLRYFEPREKYDAVISLFHVMSYQNSNEDILSAFKSARRCLNKKGVFLFDVWYGPGVLTNLPSLRVKEVDYDEKKLIRIAKPNMHNAENIVDVCYDVIIVDKYDNSTSRLQEVHSMRYFFKPEIEMLLNNAGFRLCNHLDCETLNATDYSSWTCFFIAEAI